jgi:hypothetical protein
VQADALLHETGWQFSGNGRQYLHQFVEAEAQKEKTAAENAVPER